MDYLTINLKELQKYATFESQSDMDNVIYTYIEHLRADGQPESVIEVLRFFGRSSLRVLGVSFAKYDTIASNIGYSKRTVMRAVKSLEDYGMITKTPTLKRWAGRSFKRSVNVVMIMAPQADTAVQADEATQDNECNDNKQSEPILHKHHKPYILDTDSAMNNVPTPIYEALSPFFDSSTIRRLTGVVFRAKASINRDIRIESHVAEFKACVFDCVRRLKSGQLRSIDGYLYVSLRSLFQRLHASKMNDVFVDMFG